jgi:inner membrane protein
MTKKTHLVVGTLVSVPFIASTSPIMGLISMVGICGSIAPDYDLKLGKIFHRTFTHSLMFLLFTTMIINIFSKEIALIWFISYTSHLVLDSLTRSGIPLLMPIRNKRYGLRLFTTGGIFDKILEYVGWILLVICIIDMAIKLF